MFKPMAMGVHDERRKLSQILFSQENFIRDFMKRQPDKQEDLHHEDIFLNFTNLCIVSSLIHLEMRFFPMVINIK
jgi:hypothetical protein